jgi:hypothetical protein
LSGLVALVDITPVDVIIPLDALQRGRSSADPRHVVSPGRREPSE